MLTNLNTMFSSIFLQQVIAETSSTGNAGNDLVIILLCLGMLSGMVYLFKYILEKYGVARKRNVLSSHSTKALDNREA